MVRNSVRTILLAIVLVIGGGSAALAQTTYKVGDRIEVDINMSSSPASAKWRPATIFKIEIWQGQVSGYLVRTDDGAEIVTAERFMRPASASTPQPASASPAQATPTQAAGDSNVYGQFKVGDRVQVDSIMAGNPADSRWRNATVAAIEPENQRIVVTLDDFNQMSVLIRPGKAWIRPLNDGSTTPKPKPCPFMKDYAPVAQKAGASTALFKSVIFAWRQEVNANYYDFGLTFTKFQMGRSYKNRSTTGGRKLVDPAPIGAVIYPVKATELSCRKDLSITLRTVTQIEYACYRSEFAEWVCKNGAPKILEHSSAPN